MPALRVLAATARTLSILVAPDGALYTLKVPVAWVLEDESGEVVARGATKSVALFLEGLEPESTYRLRTALGNLNMRTDACAGLVDAGDHGVDAERQNNADALAAAIAAVPEGGTLRVAGGVIRTGPIFLKPDMTLHIEEGTTLAAIADRTGWPQLPARDDKGRVVGSWEGLPEPCFAALITALDCDGVTITGAGTVDGGGDRGDWWDWPKETRNGARRPRTLHLVRGEGASVTGLTIRNAPSWTVHPYLCRNLHLSALRIENPPDSPNTDGLNPESCEDVAIVGIDFSVGDDCIAIKAGKRGSGANTHLAPTRRVAITHCRMERGHGAVVLGSEMSGGIHDVTISNCEFDRTDRGLRLKTRRGRGGEISNVLMRNVTMERVPTPLAINAFYFCDVDGKDDWVQTRDPAPVSTVTPRIANIALENVTAYEVTVAAAAILGLPEAPIEGVRLTDFRVSYDPDATADIPLMALGVDPVRHGGILTDFAMVVGDVRTLTRPKDLISC